MGPKRSERPASGTPLSRYADWYDALSDDLRAHLTPLLFEGEGTSVELQGGVGDPGLAAGRAAELAARTDAVLADPAVREQWTGEEALARLDPEARGSGRRTTIRERAISRSIEWMRALEQWAALRDSGLAGRRIERWRVKTEGTDGRSDQPPE
jgi:hypothetical protein